jgi:thioesterase domain-containing protein/acyl carrier protein
MSPTPDLLGGENALRSRHDVRDWLVNKLAGTLKADPASIDVAAPLYSLGVDSLTAITLTGELAEWLHRDISATLMWDHGSIDAIAGALADAAAEKPLPGVVYLQPQGQRKPLFCFSGARGHCAIFAPLAAQLGSDQPCYGLTTPTVDPCDSPLDSVETIAAAMLPTLRMLQPKGPYQLAGFSFGGLLAFEIAQRLRVEGETVSVLALYDTFTPQGYVQRPLWQRVALHAYVAAMRAGRSGYTRQKLKNLLAARSRRKKQGRTLSHAANAQASLVSELERNRRRAAEQYCPRPYPDRLVLFRATDRSPEIVFSMVDLKTNGWRAVVADRVQVVDISATHESILAPANAAHAASVLRPFLA